MQKNTTLFIQIVCIILLITAFSLPWIEKGLISVSGFKVPLINEKATKITNVLYFLSPSKKSAAKIGYVFYIVPLLSLIAGTLMFFIKRNISKYILLVACIFGVVFSLYFYNTLKFSLIGNGPLVLLLSSLLYIILFFTPLMKTKKVSEKEEEIIDKTPISEENTNTN